MRFHFSCCRASGDKTGGPAELQTISAGRAVNVQYVANEIKVRKEAGAHGFEIHFIQGYAAACHYRFLGAEKLINTRRGMPLSKFTSFRRSARVMLLH